MSKERDIARLNQRATECWHLVYPMLVDLQGRPLGEVLRLNPSATHPRRLREFRWTKDGWASLGNGVQGRDLVDVVAYLGAVDRATAADYLDALVKRIVTVEKGRAA